MAYIIYNGTDTRSLGVLVEKMPECRRASRQTVTANPPGFDGALINDAGAYNTYNTSLSLNCFGACTPREIFAAFTGEGWMTTSDNPDRRRYVYFYGEQSAERYRRGKTYDSVTLPLICDPFEYELQPETLTVSSGTLLPGRGDVDARPLVVVSGSENTTLMIGSCTLIIEGLKPGEPLYIDSAAKFAYILRADTMVSAFAAGIKVIMQTSKRERWPLLNHEGTTAISWTGAANVAITPNWRWL